MPNSSFAIRSIRPPFSVLPFFFIATLGFTDIVRGNDLPEVLVVHQQTVLVPEGSSGPSGSERHRLREGTMVLGLRKAEVAQTGGMRWLVTTNTMPARGWVTAGDVTPFSSYVSELSSRAIALRSERRSDVSSLPDLIVLQGNPTIRDAWERVSDAIAENEMLPVQERLPEPYFARAEIWVSVKNYFAAMQDYLTGIRYARNLGRNVASYSTYFGKLASVAKSLEANPIPAKGAVNNWVELARMRFSLGFGDYFSGSYQDALTHFSNCVALAPDEAHYWYFRALVHRALGDLDRARHDALLGAHFEKGSYSQRRLMNARLGRVQGADRSWLERQRLGLVTFHIVGAK